ncbi:FlhC family transcriptional regulator [Undibacterium sp. RTI2.2]|nr:FlhC family transcriptional regulator [Undibacterium sp. RTI2.2]
MLYRLAYDAGLPHIHSIIASYSWYTMLAGADPLPIDRMGVLVNGVQSGSGMMYVAACRKCKGNYLLSNTDEKKEFSHDYHCEACKRRSPLAA